MELAADALARHERFVEDVVLSGVVFGLQGNEGWVTSESTRDDTAGLCVMPFWSQAAYARASATQEWSAAEPGEIPLNKFIIAWLTGMYYEQQLAGTNWSASLTGHEINPRDLQRELIKALSPERRDEFEAELAWVRSEFDNPDYEILPCDLPDSDWSVPEEPLPSPKPKKKTQKPDAFVDSVLAWTFPAKPWRWIEPGSEECIAAFRFGKSYDGLQLRILAPEYVDDDVAYIEARRRELYLSANEAFQPSDREVTKYWSPYELKGPIEVPLGKVVGRSYIATVPRNNNTYEWILIEAQEMTRVIELWGAFQRRWEGDRKEAASVLKRLSIRPPAK